MNRLFILWNGFDLNLGLPTSYKFFYNYYTAKSSPSNNIAKMKENIEQYEDKDWKDLELGIGAYTKDVENPDTLEEVYVDLNTNLSEYLSLIDNFKFPFFEKIKEKILKDLSRPEKYLTKAEQIILTRFASNLSSNTANNVVTFNYTHTLENILGKERNVAQTILHIHREIGDSGLMLGVDNIGQISNEAFRSDGATTNFLVNPIANKLFGSLVDENFNTLIDNANLICLFGISLGDTDRTWWKRIGNRLLSTDNCRIIYFVKTNKTFQIDQQKLNYKRKCQQFFLDAMQIDKKNNNRDILSRIDVVLDSSILDDDFVNKDLDKAYSLIVENKLT